MAFGIGVLMGTTSKFPMGDGGCEDDDEGCCEDDDEGCCEDDEGCCEDDGEGCCEDDEGCCEDDGEGCCEDGTGRGNISFQNHHIATRLAIDNAEHAIATTISTTTIILYECVMFFIYRVVINT